MLINTAKFLVGIWLVAAVTLLAIGLANGEFWRGIELCNAVAGIVCIPVGYVVLARWICGE